MSEAVVVLCTAPSAEVAASLGRSVVEARLAACANLIDPIRSIYAWQGAIHDEGEVQLVLKTVRARLPALFARLEAEHPYDVPELIALPTADVGPAYMEWLVAQTTPA